MEGVAKLRRLGVRYVFDPSVSSHRAGDGDQYLDVEYLLQGPPLSLLSPVVGVVFGDTVCFVHSAALSAAHIVSLVQANDPGACRRVKLWGARIELVCINPPGIANVPLYITSYLYRCRCRDCRTTPHSVDAAVQAIADYCGDG